MLSNYYQITQSKQCLYINKYCKRNPSQQSLQTINAKLILNNSHKLSSNNCKLSLQAFIRETNSFKQHMLFPALFLKEVLKINIRKVITYDIYLLLQKNIYIHLKFILRQFLLSIGKEPIQTNTSKLLTHLMPLISGFLMFLGGIKRHQWHEMS